MKLRRIFALALCLILLLATLAGCSSNVGNAAPDGYYDSMNGAGNELSGPGSNNSGSTGVLTDRKLIRKIGIEAETEDMDALLADINQRIAQLNGYIESRDIQNGSNYYGNRYRHATLVIRIPADKLDSFVQQLDKASNIVSTTESSDDVTLQYVDTESRLKVLRTEEERLLQFLSEAKTVTEMLEIEKRLTSIQSEIESLTAQLKTYDNLVDYGTVTINIREVEVYTEVEVEEPTMWEQITATFADSIDNLLAAGKAFLIWLLGNSPYLVLIGIIILVVWLILRSRLRRRRHKRTPPPPPPAQETE